jgi:N-formylglutamate amidohydrolase
VTAGVDRIGRRTHKGLMSRRTKLEAQAPLVFASPHSGRLYPSDMRASPALGETAIRGSEDAFVDELLAAAPAEGATVLLARYARAYVDLNREAFELDQTMFVDRLPSYARARTARVAAGLGSIARVVADGQEIYDRKLTFAEAARRISLVHRPYHDALKSLLDAAKARHGFAVLIDWHSMPAAAVQMADPGVSVSPDMVLGDRYGAACAPGLTTAVEAHLGQLGFRTARNAPYAGGFTTEGYGRPRDGIHALQIEINRGLYLDEKTCTKAPDFAALANKLGQLFSVLTRLDWKQAGVKG